MAEHDFETLASESFYQGAIFALRRDEVRMPGGNIAKREVIEHYGAVAVVAMNENKDIALVYQYRHAYGRRIWELPAGLLDAPDEAPHLTAERELEEEVGLHARTWQVLLDVDTAPGYSDESVRVYLATGLTDIGRPQGHDEEADMTMRWFALHEAVDKTLNGDIVNSIAIAGIFAAHAMAAGIAEPRPLDTPWIDKPTAFAERKAAQ
ncbi:NUDIX domain-containing protein [Mycobacterium camsae]|uniref:NUDIX domain-containing protein n=1 Tax=Mycobacterium gordonae TaxID=1778 RepID=UPI00197E6E00|nr:NUDIX hydrolase [Mycobacterium gordonae]